MRRGRRSGTSDVRSKYSNPPQLTIREGSKRLWVNSPVRSRDPVTYAPIGSLPGNALPLLVGLRERISMPLSATTMLSRSGCVLPFPSVEPQWGFAGTGIATSHAIDGPRRILRFSTFVPACIFVKVFPVLLRPSQNSLGPCRSLSRGYRSPSGKLPPRVRRSFFSFFHSHVRIYASR